MIADEKGQQRHGDQRPEPRATKVQNQKNGTSQGRAGIQEMPARQLFRLAVDAPRQLAKGHDRAAKGDRPDKDAQEHLDPQDRLLDGVLMRQLLSKPDQHGLGAFVKRQNAGHFQVGIEADEDRRKTHKAVQSRYQLRHFGHLHPGSDNPARRRSDDHHHRDDPYIGNIGRQNRRRYR